MICVVAKESQLQVINLNIKDRQVVFGVQAKCHHLSNAATEITKSLSHLQ